MLTTIALITVLAVADTHIGYAPMLAANYSGFINRNPEKSEPTPIVLPSEKKKKFNFDFDFDLPEQEPEQAVVEPADENAPPAVVETPVAPEPTDTDQHDIKPDPPLAETPPEPEPKPAVAVQPEPAAQPETEHSPVKTVAPVAPQPAAQTVARFQRLNDEGLAVTDTETWACVEDTRNGLVWEVKTRDGGLRDSEHSFTWYDPSLDNQAGIDDGGRCDGGIDCDTWSYQQAVNHQNLCGYTDWRLPTKQELQTLVSFNRQHNEVTIDTEYFPDAVPSWYWTASSNDSSPQYAWYVLFRNGVPLNDLKERPKHIRLVRGGQPTLARRE